MAVYKDVVTREELTNIIFDEKDPNTFYDIFETNGAGPRFDCLHLVGYCPGDCECYIVDRETGHYINWYKLYHVGRDYTTNMSSKEEIKQFMHNFYEESDKSWNQDD